MAEQPESAGVFYADGHVRVYHGKTDRSTSALCGAGATLFACHHRLLGQCDGWTALFHGQLRGPGLLSVLRRADCAAAPAADGAQSTPRWSNSKPRPPLKPLYDRLRPGKGLLARFLRPDEKSNALRS